MDKRDADLELHHRTWTIDGDLYRCRHCQRGCLASKAREKFIHAGDCSVKDTACDYPWLALAEMMAAVATPAEPVIWGAPKTVRQLIQQLQTLGQDLRPLSMLRVPGNVFEDGKERTRAVHLSTSYERVDGQWLVPFKSEGEKVIAFWCRMENPNPLAEAEERDKLIAYGRNCGLDEASTLCSRMAYDTYYPAESRFKHFIPKALEQQGNLLIKAANAIASLPDGPYDRFKANQQKKAGTSATA